MLETSDSHFSSISRCYEEELEL